MDYATAMRIERRRLKKLSRANLLPYSRGLSKYDRVDWRSLRHKVARQIFLNRCRKDMNQEELAERLGTKTSNISRIENEKQNITIDYLERIAKALEMEVIIELREPKPTKERVWGRFCECNKQSRADPETDSNN